MSHEVETMAYANELPWHGLGYHVSEDLTPNEMLVAAKLDWRVNCFPMKATLPNKKGSLAVEDYRALVRSSDDKVLGICGSKYVPVQNERAFEFFKRFTEAGKMKMETAGALDGGRKVWALAKISDGFTLAGGDEVRGYLLLSNPHIWGKSMEILFTPVRVVCNNTLTMALGTKSNKFRHPHITEFNDSVESSALNALGLAQEQLDTFKVQAELLASVKYTEDMVKAFIARAMQPSAMDEEGVVEVSAFNRNALRVLKLVEQAPGWNLPSANGTMWGLMNAVTYFYDHEYGRTADARLTSSWFGSNATKKRAAMEVALELAEAA